MIAVAPDETPEIARPATKVPYTSSSINEPTVDEDVTICLILPQTLPCEIASPSSKRNSFLLL